MGSTEMVAHQTAVVHADGLGAELVGAGGAGTLCVFQPTLLRREDASNSKVYVRQINALFKGSPAGGGGGGRAGAAPGRQWGGLERGGGGTQASAWTLPWLASRRASSAHQQVHPEPITLGPQPWGGWGWVCWCPSWSPQSTCRPGDKAVTCHTHAPGAESWLPR